MPRRPTAPQGIRIARWRPDPGLARLSLAAQRGHPLHLGELRRHLDGLEAAGFRGVVTAALPTLDQPVFLDAGFRVIEWLHLLRHNLDRPDLRGSTRTRRARGRERRAVLAVDHASFAPFWQLDESMLAEALAATRTARLRVVCNRHNRIVGYAICGRSGPRGYVQRLAVHPDSQGQGLGTSLLADGLAWLARWGARDALVNTQLDNRDSLRLYRRAGFEMQPNRLAMLRLDFGAHDHRPRGDGDFHSTGTGLT